MAHVVHYARPVDAWNGFQNVAAADGHITFQELVARQGHYTGDGNPELIGQSESILTGMGFRQVPGEVYFDRARDKWLSEGEDVMEFLGNASNAQA